MRYNKILILGGIGSGKTTLANKLSKLLKIKHYELDNIAYKRRDIHIKSNTKEKEKKLKLVLKKKNWIIEGYYSKPWTHPIYKKADIIILLKIKPSTAKLRIIKRFIKRKFFMKKNKKTNKSLKIMIKLLKHLQEEKYEKKLKSLEKIAKKRNRNIVLLKNKKELNNFLRKLK